MTRRQNSDSEITIVRVPEMSRNVKKHRADKDFHYSPVSFPGPQPGLAGSIFRKTPGAEIHDLRFGKNVGGIQKRRGDTFSSFFRSGPARGGRN